jgi:2-oxoglutarate ferredoxin oxidoreductase subunit alpha
VTEVKHERGIHHIGIPFTAATVEAVGGSARDCGKNIFVLGLLCAEFHLDKDKVVGIPSRQFGKKDESVLRNAMLAYDAGFAYPIGDITTFNF